MPSYNVTVELVDRLEAPLGDSLVSELADYHPAVSRSIGGRAAVVLTIPADSLRQATVTALSVVTAHGYEAYGLEVLPTDEFDRRIGLEPMPDLLSVTEAAEALGVSRQAVLQRIEAGTVPAQRVGSAWALPANGLAALAARVVRQAVDAGVLDPNEAPLDRSLRRAKEFLDERGSSQISERHPN